MHLAKPAFIVCAGLLCLAATHAPAAAELELDSGLIPNGGTYVHTFAAAGVYPYYCVIHGPGMQGTVNVVAGGPQTAAVTIENNRFNPESVIVAPGGTVTWTNFGVTTVTSIPPAPTKSTWGRIKALYR